MRKAAPIASPEPVVDPFERDDAQATEIALGPMDHKVGFHLWLAHSILGRDLTSRLVAVGLTPRQCSLLTLIGANPGSSQVALAALLDTDRATMMGLIDRLEDGGFVERRRSLVDRRRQELYVTDAGHVALDRAEEQMALNEAQADRVLDAVERRTLIELLRRLHERGNAEV